MFLRLSCPFYDILDTLSDVWKYVRSFKPKQEDSEFINVDKAFTQNYILITRWQQIIPRLPQET
jgi:hypothetical protein